MDLVTDRGQPGDRLIGRDHELRVLAASFERAADGHGGLVLLGGEAGIGKTAIVEEFALQIGRTGVVPLSGACIEGASPSPYSLWRGVLTPAERVAGARRSFWPDDHEMEFLPDQVALFSIVLDRVRELSRQRPSLLILEDIHWADRESLELLRFLGRVGRELSLLIVCTYRSDEVTTGHVLYDTILHLVREARAERIDLRRFSDASIREVIQTRYSLELDDEDRLVQELFKRTDGNPFFIVELLRSMEMAGLIAFQDGRWRLGSLETVDVPLLVRQLVDSRFLRLDATARSALQIASVIGNEIPTDLWMTLTGVGADELSRITRQALDNFLLEQSSRGTTLRFRHALVQDAIYSGLPVPWRMLQHRRVAEQLAETPGVDPATVATHFTRAGDPQAGRWHLSAARNARRFYAPYAIIHHVNAALEREDALLGDDRKDAFQLRGWAREITGHFDIACEDYLAELRIATDRGDHGARLGALMRLAELWAGRDYSQASRYIEQALHAATELGDQSLMGRCLNRMGNWFLNREDPDRARDYHRQALELFEAAGDRAGIASTEDLLGMTCILGGDPIQGSRHYARAIELFESLDDRTSLASALANFSMRGMTYQTEMMVADSTTLEACARDAEQAIAVSSGIGFRSGEVYALIRLGSCLGARGEYQPALDALERGLAGAEEIGHRQWISAACCVSGSIHLDLLDTSSAVMMLRRGREAAEQSGTIHWMRSNSGLLALAYAAAGERDLAISELETSLTDTVPARTLAQRHLWRARIELELASGNYPTAITLVDTVLEQTPHAGRDRPAARLSLLRARGLIATGAHEEATRWLLPACDAASEQGARSLLWRLRRELGLAYAGLGIRPAASREFFEAHRLIDEMGASIDDDDFRARFLDAAHSQVPEPATPTELQSAKLTYGGLTRRQREVAALMARGFSNRAIADKLSVSERTVESHVTAIYSTLALESRAQVATWCIQHGLIDRSPL